ncbi:carbamate kinase [Streptomyces sp. H10-C2]|uniref:carbamate kinase n=1 Tax=unclassified Streptomyces TaxID=2593676 RepID=UPI0024BBE617|nr:MULTISPECIES: carbamate kinase [unclassified Streptomyces]MDJ0344721.1 carbamate kinase [Streptomyces sp. PH10-H1]MDJ0371210.1 carbamate kinase [Streptomyces sp. H10-C2]
MRIVAALGGNALLRRGERPDAGIQLDHVRAAAQALAPLAEHHELIICHGNGPQVGMLSRESESDPALTRPYPLDVLVAQTQGMIGYWLAQCLRNAGVTKPVLSLITQTLVDPSDPAFAAPTKFIGPVYDHRRALVLADRNGWAVAADGDRWRRVVPSPDPQRIVEQASITRLLDAGTVVICGGGGGAPVIDDGAGGLQGAEAVVDKDATSALLAIAVHADRLLVLTDVPAVMEHFGTPQAAPLDHLDLDEPAGLHFPAGSMGPKIAACRHFVSATGRSAAIGSLSEATAVLNGTAGTTITAGRTRQGDTSSVDAPAADARRSGIATL